MEQFKKRLLYGAPEITARVEELASQVSAEHPEGNLLIIGILKGSFMFVADLVRKLTVSCQIDFVRISSYGTGMVSKGSLDIIMDAGISVKGRDVILVDDIVDSGLTLSEYRKRLERKGPRCIKTAAMVDKTGRRESHVHLDYYGFRIEDGFLVGYGLDCDERFRNLDGIYVLE